MAAHHELFIRTSNSEAQTVSGVATAIGHTMEAVSPINDATSYRAVTGRTVVELEMTHEFDRDGQLHFDQYPALLTVRDLDGDQHQEEVVARGIFDHLKAQSGYDLLLVFDFQKLLALT